MVLSVLQFTTSYSVFVCSSLSN